jgi:hypothetical protein
MTTRNRRIVLAQHPLTGQLQNCDSVESVTSILHEQTAFSQFRGKDKIIEPLKNALSVLDKLSATANLWSGYQPGTFMDANKVFSVSDPHPVEFRACDGNTHASRCPTPCMCHLRPCVHLRNIPVERHGLFLFEDGQTLFLWVGRDTVLQLIIDVFDLPNYETLRGGKVSFLAVEYWRIIILT